MEIFEKKKSILTKNFFKKNKSIVWMSHQDAVVKIPKNFINIASTKDSKFTIIQHQDKKIFGLLYIAIYVGKFHKTSLILNF